MTYRIDILFLTTLFLIISYSQVEIMSSVLKAVVSFYPKAYGQTN